MRLMGSFHTITSQGRSGRTSSPPSGASTSTGWTSVPGPVMGRPGWRCPRAPRPRARSRLAHDRDDAGLDDAGLDDTGRDDRVVQVAVRDGAVVGEPVVEPQHRHPHHRGAEDVDAHEQRREVGEVLGVADATLDHHRAQQEPGPAEHRRGRAGVVEEVQERDGQARRGRSRCPSGSGPCPRGRWAGAWPPAPRRGDRLRWWRSRPPPPRPAGPASPG